MIRRVLFDLGMIEFLEPTPLFNDNRGAVDSIREVAVRDDVKAGDIVIFHLPGINNIADLFTKEISCDKLFQSFAFQLISPRDL